MSEKFQKFILLTIGVLVMSVSVTYFLFAWQEPNQPPPQGNVQTPINVGPQDQVKEGGLSVGAFISRYGTILAKDSGNVGIGTTNPKYKLDVAGQIGSNIGCCIGGNCINSWSKGTAYLSYAGCGPGDTEVARWTEYTRTVYNYNAYGETDSYVKSPVDPGYLPGLGYDIYYQHVSSYTARIICK